MSKNLAAVLEVDDAQGNTNEFEVSGKLKLKSKVNTFTAMANVLYVMPLDGLPISPYFGGGVGYANHRVGDVTYIDFPGGLKEKGESAGAFAYQFMAGLKYRIENIELGVGYRFMGSSDAKFGTVKAKVLTHNIEAGITFRF